MRLSISSSAGANVSSGLDISWSRRGSGVENAPSKDYLFSSCCATGIFTFSWPTLALAALLVGLWSCLCMFVPGRIAMLCPSSTYIHFLCASVWIRLLHIVICEHTDFENFSTYWPLYNAYQLFISWFYCPTCHKFVSRNWNYCASRSDSPCLGSSRVWVCRARSVTPVQILPLE